MDKKGIIIVIEDDLDDQFVLEEAFLELDFPNKRIYFPDGFAALNYLRADHGTIFLILSDVNLPKLTGLELRIELKKNADIALKCVPYLYLTTSLNHAHVVDAYCDSVQGFFVKPAGFEEIKELLETIVRYWTASASSRLHEECF